MSTDAPSTSILVNGEPRASVSGTGLLPLLTELGLPPQGVLVELNGQALLRDEWPGVRLQTGDRLEILRVVAGG